MQLDFSEQGDLLSVNSLVLLGLSGPSLAQEVLLHAHTGAGQQLVLQVGNGYSVDRIKSSSETQDKEP